MANTKITALTPYTGYPATNDLFPFVDVSDTTMAATGSTKYITAQYILFQNGGTASLATSLTTPNYYGGTASGGTVTVNSTSHATKGVIGLGTALVMNEATNAGTVNGTFVITNTFVPGGRIGESWANAPSFNTGWGNYGYGEQPAQYKKVGDLVFLRGLVTRSSGSQTTIFTLPSGYRPSAYTRFAQPSDTGYGRIDVGTYGDVVFAAGGTGWICLDRIVFSIL